MSGHSFDSQKQPAESACCALSTVLEAWVLRAGSLAYPVRSAKWEEMQPETVAYRKPEVR